ncbi:MAG: carbon-nitrogen family hydrolase [Phycisphaerales bacterium]|jgi:omega-amidase|nr:carbon-nitrogen family hydrolase [Phycisphaerales bacterium]
MNALCIQLDIAWNDPQSNCRTIADMLENSNARPGDFAILPEMFSSGFTMDPDTCAEPPDGPTSIFLSETARQFGVYLLAGLASRYGETFRNEAVLFNPDGSPTARYWKTHPFSPAGEGDHYAPGDKAVVAPVGNFQMAPAICYDLRFPELFRSATAAGANLIAVIANWPEKRSDHWTHLLRARAIENQACVVGVNRCGRDPNHRYAGRSIIIDQQGNTLAEAKTDQCVISAPLDIKAVHRWREEFPALGDIRKDLQ